MPRRRLVFGIFAFYVFICVAFPPKQTIRSRGGRITGPPPTYEELYKWEDNLPQHNLSLPFPEGRHGRYVKFSSQVNGLGWNNVLNEILLCTHLAYKAKRAYVFQDYVWKLDYYPWRIPMLLWQISVKQPHMPLNALISGPTVGGPWEDGDDAPRSISDRWFNIVCPESERRKFYTDDIKPALQNSPGDVVFATWEKLLLNAPERCVEVMPGPSKKDSFPQVFDLWMISTERILPLWESFSKSPASRLLGTSPLVSSAINRNEHLFIARGPQPAHPAPRNPYDRMMALHIRRGDFKKACIGLATWNSTFYSWNLLPFLPDLFVPPSGGSWGYNTPENVEKYLEHCLPSMDAIVEKVREAKAAYIAQGKDRTLDVMYLLTNAESHWLEYLRRKLRDDGWHTIATSKDLELDLEQIGVGMAVDMDIARRAAVFIGNGWSSFTNNIVHRRLVDGKEYISNRFW